jgi:hypothetical protein
MPRKTKTTLEATREFLKQIKVKDGDWGPAVKRQWLKLMECPPGKAVGTHVVTLCVRTLACIYLNSYCRMPASAGLEFSLEDRKTKKKVTYPENPVVKKVCILHGGVVAMRPLKAGKYVPLTTAHITAQLNEAALEPFKRAGIELTDADKAKLSVELRNVRRAVEEAEALGLVIRTDIWGKPLSQYTDAKALQSLRNKTAILAYAMPHDGTGEFLPSTQRRVLRDELTDRNESEMDTANSAISPAQLLLPYSVELGISAEKSGQYAGRPEIAGKLLRIQEQRRRLADQEARLKDELAKIAAQDAQGTLFPPQERPGRRGKGAEAPPSMLNPSEPAQTPATAAPISTNDRIESGAPAGTTPPLDATEDAAPPASSAEVYAVLEVLRQYGVSGADDEAAAELLKRCRSREPSCTVLAVNEAIAAKAPVLRNVGMNKGNVVGAAITYVPKMFSPAVEQQRQAAKAADAERQVEEHQRWRQASAEEARQLLNAKNASESDRRIAQELLDSLGDQ